MAFVSATLQASALQVFTAMDSITDNSGNEYFADQISTLLKAYILTGQVSTVDTGTTAAGTYAGSGVGTLTLDAEVLKSDLIDTFEAGYDDDGLAEHMALDIDNACKADGAVQITSTGTVTPPSGSSSVFSGPGEGVFLGSKSIIENGLKACFSVMLNMTEGGNEYFANQLALCITSYLTQGSISVELQIPPFLSGSGIGGIS